jgi:hypothetical protein
VSSFTATVEATEGHYIAQSWDEEYKFVHSHDGELIVLLHYLRGATLRNAVVLWVTDCEAAMWSLNKGNCDDEIALEHLREILRIADEKRLQLVGLWIPREYNRVSDYLSHLTHYLGRQSAEGELSEDCFIGAEYF